MALTKLTDNVSNVSSLDDKPSLSSTELKRVFDRGNESIKEYINTILIPELEERTYELINDLTSGGTTKVLSAEMGKKLNNEIACHSFHSLPLNDEFSLRSPSMTRISRTISL